MPHKIKLVPEGYRGLRPRDRSERSSLVLLGATIACAVLVVLGFWVLQQKWQVVRELTWEQQPGIIEQIQHVPSVVANSIRGGGMLYSAQVLARFEFRGVAWRRSGGYRLGSRLSPSMRFSFKRLIGKGVSVLSCGTLPTPIKLM